jgi:V/A-type H+/Na+-transporting ATPase subunit K
MDAGNLNTMGLGYILALVGLGLMVGLAGGGSAIGTSIAGSATLGLFKKKPEAFGMGMVLSGVPGTQGLYGFVAFFLYNSVITNSFTVLQGSIVLGAGVAVGAACLISGIYQGKVGANGIQAIGSGYNVFGNTMILAAFPEFYAILSLIAAILMMPLLKL